MKQVSKVKQFGAIAIIAGTAIGAGMLGIPFAVAAVGFNYALMALFLVWIIMYATALLIVEANVSQPLGTDMDSIAHNILGKSGRVMNLLFYLLLLYSLLTAYIFMGGQLFETYVTSWFNFGNDSFAKFLFTFVFGFFIYKGIRVVFRVNELFLSLKVLAFVLFISFVAPQIRPAVLESRALGVEYVWFSIPILVTSFGFHIVIPAIRNYFENDIVFKRTVAAGALAPLIVYLVWVMATLGTINLHGGNGFIDLSHSGKTLAEAYVSLGQRAPLIFIRLFENFAIITSFLGVALALFSFNQDLYALNSRKKLITLIITLLPPLFFAIYFVNSFIAALGYASIFVSVLLIVQPALMVWAVRTKQGNNSILSKLYLSLILFCGMGIIALQLLVAFGRLPHI
ncbi:amino acid permease [Francisella philomiragia]|uniref:Tryptophan/tyrosine permease family protein n=1 Tax=Francisella philomiragia TaxID=28110 RepID=A0A080Q6Q8_9GAMM|nr:aromatic amino acid transport family protein [Francisella philomiragia]AJI52891.1 tryptophan/tyrosine permease family protein [Francisella philomiragia]AJI55338.1 tryptophan/tyrosine permease family protein [Francisella philomiragia]EET20879.1 hydroxy/aromatic amino acid permease [Francisella philomiragia subsp. philomiragia ATCC 25015]KFJ42795.1 tryptophan/tyrosine permease family protein [Francisella philomiragia]MBK2026395.1 amino acid transporter [Francisella philomiragia]